MKKIRKAIQTERDNVISNVYMVLDRYQVEDEHWELVKNQIRNSFNRLLEEIDNGS